MRWSYGHDRARPALEPFDALIGTWATEATHRLFDAVVPGSITFEWFAGGHFLVQRSHNDHELFPDAISVIGPPEAGDGLPRGTIMVQLLQPGLTGTLTYDQAITGGTGRYADARGTVTVAQRPDGDRFTFKIRTSR